MYVEFTQGNEREVLGPFVYVETLDNILIGLRPNEIEPDDLAVMDSSAGLWRLEPPNGREYGHMVVSATDPTKPTGLKDKVVRVVRIDGDMPIDSCFLDCLARAGLVDIHPTDPKSLTWQCFDIIAPSAANSSEWAQSVAATMVTNGYNAVVAPSTRD